MSQWNKNSTKKILFLVSGSIAIYKACSLISLLVQKGHEVQVATTPNAMNFIGASTLEGLTGKPVLSDTFAPQHAMDHIQWIRWADLVLLCPATANTINKMAHGIGDDLVTTFFLAHDFKKPFVVAPAMNSSMYLHPITQKSLFQLSEMGLEILNPNDGPLACGELGRGRLMEPDQIYLNLEKHLNNNYKPIESHSPLQMKTPESQFNKKSPQKYKILVTSGGTQEPIDSMRVISNLSTGRTGAMIADSLSSQGFEVDYLGAQSSVKPLQVHSIFTYLTFNELNNQLEELISKNQYLGVIHAAAVSDFHVAQIQGKPIHNSDFNSKLSSQDSLTLTLEPNFKILPRLKTYSKTTEPLIVGFKFTSSLDSEIQKKSVNKLFNEGGVDLVVHNDSYEIDKKNGIHPFAIYSFSEKKADILNPSQLGEFLGDYFFKSINKRDQTL